MAKAPASDTIMPADKMKPLLALSKKEPVHAAIGLSAEGDGLLLLDKKASPRKVMSMLRASAEKGKLKLVGSSLRFGRAEVDVDYDPGMVRLFINKDAPGAMRLKLIEVVKRIPYQKVEINVDPSLEEEGEEGGEASEAQPASAAAPPQASPPLPPAPAAAPLDPATLTQALRELIGRITQVTATLPARKPELAKLAFEAGAALKGGKLDAAAEALAKLRAALDPPAEPGPAPSPAPGPAPGPAPRPAPGQGEENGWPAAREAWQDANDAVNDQINALRAALIGRAKGDDDDDDDYAEALNEIAESGLNAITEDHRVKLMAAIMELGASPQPGQPSAKALGQIQAFQAFLDGSEKIAVCDQNPFGAPVSIRATLGPALQAMTAALQAGEART